MPAHQPSIMRIEFANAVHADIDWSGDRLRIGSAADNDVVLAGPGIAAHHAWIGRDARGLVLQVLPGAGRVYANARPVRERALLRVGDTLGLGDCRLRLCADAAPAAPPLPPRDGQATAALRAVAGPHSGRVVDIGEGLELGPRGRLPLALGGDPAAAIVRRDGALWLQAEALPDGIEVRLNGRSTRHACLGDGDQLVIGTHRFIVDAWAPPPRTPVAPEPATGGASPEDTAGARGEVWWLILTAAVLALVIALLLLVRL